MGIFLLVSSGIFATDGKFNTDDYCSILDDSLHPTFWQFYVLDICYFQDDNAICHVARSTMYLSCGNEINQVYWPAQIREVNSTKNI